MVCLSSLLRVLILNVLAKNLHKVPTWLVTGVVCVAHLQHQRQSVSSVLEYPILTLLVYAKTLLVYHLVDFTLIVLDLLTS